MLCCVINARARMCCAVLCRAVQELLAHKKAVQRMGKKSKVGMAYNVQQTALLLRSGTTAKLAVLANHSSVIAV
jgi:hypothetical protein